MARSELSLRIKEWKKLGINQEGIAALKQSYEDISFRVRSISHPLSAIFETRRFQLPELVTFLGESNPAQFYRSRQPDDPQRGLIVHAVTKLIMREEFNKVDTAVAEKALEGTRKAFERTLVL